MEVNARVKFTSKPFMHLLHKPKFTDGKAAKPAKQNKMKTDPQYSCHCTAQWNNSTFVFAGSQMGEIFYWKWEEKQSEISNYICVSRGKFYHENKEKPVFVKFRKVILNEPADDASAHNGSIVCITYHPIFKLLITGSADCTMKVWDVFGIYGDARLCIQTIQEHTHTVTCLATHGDLLISGSVDATIRFWKVDQERMNFGLNPWFCQRFTFSANGWITKIHAEEMPVVSLQGQDELGDIVVGDMTGILWIFKSVPRVNQPDDIVNIALRKKKVRLQQNPISMLNLILSHNLLVIGSNNHRVYITDAPGHLKFVNLLNERGTNYIDCQWNTYNEELFLLDKSGYLDIFGFRQDKMLYEMKIDDEPQNLTFHNGCDLLISGRYGLVCYRVTRNVPFKEYLGHTDPVVGLFMKSISQDIKDVRFTEKLLVSAGQDSKICVWNVDKYSMKLARTQKESGQEELYCFHFVESMDLIVTGHAKGFVSFCLFDENNDASTWVKGHKDTVSCITSVEFDKEEGENSIRYVVTGSFDGKIGMCNISDFLRLQRTPYYEYVKQAYSSTVLSLLSNEMEENFISGGSDGVIKIWNRQLKLIQKLEGHKDGVTSLAMDGYFLFSGSEDSTIIMWDTLSGTNLKQFEKHFYDIFVITIVPSTGDIISGDKSGQLLMWNYSSSEIKFKYQKKGVELTSIYFDVDQSDIYCGTNGGQILKVNTKDRKDPTLIVKEYEDEKEKRKYKKDSKLSDFLVDKGHALKYNIYDISENLETVTEEFKPYDGKLEVDHDFERLIYEKLNRFETLDI